MSSSEIIRLVEICAPLVFGVLIAWFSYKYSIRQKRYESQQEYLQNVNQILSVLLVLWKDINRSRMFLQDLTTEQEVLMYMDLARDYLELDEEKFERLEKEFSKNMTIAQKYDPVLYVRSEDFFDRFYDLIDDLFYPIADDPKINFEKKVQGILIALNELQAELLVDINDLKSKHAKSQRRLIDHYLQEQTVPSENEKSEIPKYLLEFFHDNLPFIESISSDELETFYSNPTIKWAMRKVAQTGLIKLFAGNNLGGVFTFFLLSDDQKESHITSRIDLNDIVVAIDRLNISSEEEKEHFVDNKTLYLLLMGLIKKFEEKVPFEVLRTFVRMNNGDISVSKEIESFKHQIIQEIRTKLLGNYEKDSE